MLGKFFGKKKAAAQMAMQKVENKDLMEAIVAGSLLVAAADGDIGDEEVTMLAELVGNNDSLKHFGREIDACVEKYSGMLKASFLVGKTKLKKELQDVANDPEQAEEVYVNMLAIAQADGEVDAEEMKVLIEMGKILGLKPETYGVEITAAA